MMNKPLFKISLFKILFVFYFLYLIIGTIYSDYNFFHDNADFGFWTFISFLIISSLLLSADIMIIQLVENFFYKSRQLIILLIELTLMLIIYFIIAFNV